MVVIRKWSLLLRFISTIFFIFPDQENLQARTGTGLDSLQTVVVSAHRCTILTQGKSSKLKGWLPRPIFAFIHVVTVVNFCQNFKAVFKIIIFKAFHAL